jgi:hypothetical protein
MSAYETYLFGALQDTPYSEDALKESLSRLPAVQN